jgi:hypothetical protein
MKCIILENLSITTKIESLFPFDLGKPSIESIYISTQGFLYTNKELYKP